MGSAAETFSMVSKVLEREFQFRSDQLHPDTHLIDDLDLDSIDAIDLAVQLEELTGLSFGEDDLKSLRTIRDLVEMIDGRN